MNSITIGNTRVGEGHPCYIVAEMSANHHQSYERAIEILYAAKQSGADAVKVQTYRPDTLTVDCNKKHFRIEEGPWAGQTFFELYEKAYMPWEWQEGLLKEAESLGMALFSSPFDVTAVDFLEQVGIKAYKVASFELVDTPLVEHIASKGKPVLLSTGMASLGEIESAISAARSAGADQIALLKCTSAYPAPPEEMNLRTIAHLSEVFNVPTGLSDHTLGIAVPVAAVALGACIVEKHFTLSRSIRGPDSAFSLEPDEFKAMVDAIRVAEKAVGQIKYARGMQESRNLMFRRSLFVVENVKAGEVFSEKNVRSIRPGHGLAPKYLPKVLGHRASCDIDRGTPLEWEFVQVND
jgi:pseudaminic acid synthase